MSNFTKEIIQRNLRVPSGKQTTLPNEAFTYALDVTLMESGFKMSPKLMAYVMLAADRENIAKIILDSVAELIGNNVKHNVYFKNFPEDVPDTHEFWASLVVKTLFGDEPVKNSHHIYWIGSLNLLALVGYGQYQHTYDEMIANRENYDGSISDKVTVLELGDTYAVEVENLYRSLAESKIPLSDSEQDLLARVAVEVTSVLDCNITVRENLAIINNARANKGLDISFDTLTDGLRFAAAYSDGDVSLDTNTKFKSFPRSVRRQVLAELDRIVSEQPARLSDVRQYGERWKRLGERLHPSEANLSGANDLFNVARGNTKLVTLMGEFNALVEAKDYLGAAQKLSVAPGYLIRNLDLLLRSAKKDEALKIVLLAASVLPKVSLKVLISTYEHVINRVEKGELRTFVNTKGGSWTTLDTRKPINSLVVLNLGNALTAEIERRLKDIHIEVADEFADVVVPTSNKNTSEGFNILPRGSVTEIEGNKLRFFMYWKEANSRTDYDLSVIFLNENFEVSGQVSYTNLRSNGVVHSGDITSAPNGASEFIEIDLNTVDAHYIIPQVNVYSGEGFSQVEESFFGYMTFTESAKGKKNGKPFEPKAVKMKSDIRGNGRVALPVAFAKTEDGTWQAKWMHITMNGWVNFNSTEVNRYSTAAIGRGIMKREYFTIGNLAAMSNPDAENKILITDDHSEGSILPTNVADVLSSL